MAITISLSAESVLLASRGRVRCGGDNTVSIGGGYRSSRRPSRRRASALQPRRSGPAEARNSICVSGSRVEDREFGGAFLVVERAASWDPKQTAIIVCDMWDFHYCLNAVRRAKEMAPRMDHVLRAARDRGVLIIHAPSSCMEAYKDHLARNCALETPRSKDLSRDIGQW